MKKLVIAEKPSVGRDIARVLGCRQQSKSCIEGARYVVTWGLGHLVTLADPEAYDKKLKSWKAEDLPIMPKYLKLVVIPETRGQFNTVKTLIHRKDIEEIIIATDAGREGELVARWILEKAGSKKPLKRLWISSVTDQAIRNGFAHLKEAKAYDNLYRAAAARAEADWLVGINTTRALTCKYNAQLSCGRVQTPTLAMIAAREEEIRRFVPRSLYGLQCKHKDLTFVWTDKKSGSTSVFSKEKIETLYTKLQGQNAVIKEINKKKKKVPAPGLFDLTLLQREANQRFGFSAKQTLNLMQSLYERHKIVTYPRTDSRYLTADVVPTIRDRLQAVAVGPYKTYAAQLLKGKITARKTFVDDHKVSDHHAIIPTEQPVTLSALSVDERRIFDLIVRRFFSVLYPDYEYEQTQITLEWGGEIFKASAVNMTSLGYREVLEDSQIKEKPLPLLKEGQRLTNPAPVRTTGKTAAPPRFNEGTLLAAMENPVRFLEDKGQETIRTLQETGGLGTVATRADIIEKLFACFYIEKKENAIYLTSKGRQLLKLVPEDLKKPELTAGWEHKLQEISGGHLKKERFMGEIRGYAKDLTREVLNAEATFHHDNLTHKPCPQCGKRLLAVNGRHGRLLVCQDRECGYRETVSRQTNARCPNCHKKMELVGSGDNRKFVCVCGHKEGMKAFQERRNKAGAGVSKKDVARYMQKMKKEERQPLNSGLADALAGLKILEDQT